MLEEQQPRTVWRAETGRVVVALGRGQRAVLAECQQRATGLRHHRDRATWCLDVVERDAGQPADVEQWVSEADRETPALAGQCLDTGEDRTGEAGAADDAQAAVEVDQEAGLR